MNEKKEIIKNKLLNMNFNSLLEVIREVNSYNFELEEYTFYDNDEDFLLINGYGNLDSDIKDQAKKLIYDDIEYISEVITDDFVGEKVYNLSLYDEL